MNTIQNISKAMFKNWIKTLFGITLILLISQALEAQGPPPDPEIKAKKAAIKTDTEALLTILLEYADNENYPKFAKIMSYHGPHRAREMQDNMDYSDAYEALEVENTVNKINVWIDKSVYSNFVYYFVAEGLNQDFIYWDVEFTNAKGKAKTHRFCFVQFKETYLFLNID